MSETPYRYTAEMAGRIETGWQDRWEELGTFRAPNPVGDLAPQDPAARAAALLGGDRLERLVATGAPATLSDFAALRRAGWPASPVLEGSMVVGETRLQVIGVEPLTLPPGARVRIGTRAGARTVARTSAGYAVDMGPWSFSHGEEARERGEIVDLGADEPEDERETARA